MDRDLLLEGNTRIGMIQDVFKESDKSGKIGTNRPNTILKVTRTFYDMEHKFKCKEEVIFRPTWDENVRWTYGIVSHTLNDSVILSGNIELFKAYYDFLPYEGNEHLVGTTDNPFKEVEVMLKKGELVFCFDSMVRFEEYDINLGKFENIIDFSEVDYDPDGLINISRCNWNYCIPFSKFNPNDMEATKKEILTVRNGKLVKANWK